MWRVMHNSGIPERLIKLVQGIYRKSSSAIKVDNNITEYFHTKTGVRQRSILSPYISQNTFTLEYDKEVSYPHTYHRILSHWSTTKKYLIPIHITEYFHTGVRQRSILSPYISQNTFTQKLEYDKEVSYPHTYHRILSH